MVRALIKIITLVLCVSTLLACSTSPKHEPTKSTKLNLIAIEANAETAYRSGQLELAEGLYRQLLSEKRNYAPAWFRLGNIYTRTNRLDAAVTAYQNCINSDSEHAKAWHNLAIARVRQATDILIEAQNHLVVDTSAKSRMDQLFLELMRIQSSKTTDTTVASND